MCTHIKKGLILLKTSVVKKNLIPYRAGVVIVIPLDANKRPDYTKAVRTEPDFLSSTSVTMSSNVETLDNGNGNNKEYPLDETYTVSITANTYSPTFHNTLANRIETFPDNALTPDEFEYNLPLSVGEGEQLGITFGDNDIADGHVPGKDSNNEYNFLVQDRYGNTLVRLFKDGTSMPTLEKGTYYYDADTKTLMFSDDYLGELIRVTYWYNDPKSVRYSSNPIISRPEFRLEMYGIKQSADDQVPFKATTVLERVYVSGDLPDPTSQKSKSAPLTYTLMSAPVPAGMSVYHQTLTPIGEAADDGTGSQVACNGVDEASKTVTT